MQRSWQLLVLTITAISLAFVSCSAIAAKKKPHKFPPMCDMPGYDCVRVKGGQTWHSMFPDEEDRDIVMRLNRTNGNLWRGKLLLVPENLSSADVMEYAPFPKKMDVEGEKTIVVDLRAHAWGAFDTDGTLIKWGPATGGKDWCSDIDEGCRTKAGSYRIYTMGSSNCVSSKFPVEKGGGAPMPFCMFFHGGQALHGSPGGVLPGNASHGCVRLFVQDAEWLRYDFVDGPMAANNYRGTRVIIKPY